MGAANLPSRFSVPAASAVESGEMGREIAPPCASLRFHTLRSPYPNPSGGPAGKPPDGQQPCGHSKVDGGAPGGHFCTVPNTRPTATPHSLPTSAPVFVHWITPGTHPPPHNAYIAIGMQPLCNLAAQITHPDNNLAKHGTLDSVYMSVERWLLESRTCNISPVTSGPHMLGG